MIKILIIDDERAIRDMMKKRLSAHFNCWIDIAANTKQGFDFIKRKRYNIVFVDYLFLDNMDGFNFLYQLKREHEGAYTVMMSGFIKDMEEAELKGQGVKPDEFIPKPFPEGALMGVMDKYFKNERKKADDDTATGESADHRQET